MATFVVVSESYNVTSSEMKYSRQKIASPFKRLHATPTHNTSPERVRAGGLIPGDFGSRPISSDSFFRPNTFDPPSTRQRRMDFSHELRVVKSPTNEALDAYKRPVGDLCSVSAEGKGSFAVVPICCLFCAAVLDVALWHSQRSPQRSPLFPTHTSTSFP